jgi:DNA modification methylase
VFNQILCGNHLEILPRFPDDCFDMWLTSPPYDNLRTYQGYDFQFEPLAQELFRVLKPGGVGVWVVNDATIDGSETGTSFKQALYFMSCGLSLHDTMIYEKNGPAYPSADKYFQVFEYMFVFAKGKPLTLNLLADRYNRWAGQKWSKKRTRRKTDGTMTRSDWSPDQGGEYGRRFNVWKYNVGHGYHDSDGLSREHPATFPERLAEDHILSWSNPGDVILDPMCGSGTTCKMAAKHGRKYVGIDIAEKYCDIARKRVALIEAQPLLFNENAGEQVRERDLERRA